MSKPRKTFYVAEFVIESNRLLALDTISTSEKQGICHMVEHVLMQANRYDGFNFNYWLETGFTLWRDAGQPGNTIDKDQYVYGPTGCQYSRRYYVKGYHKSVAVNAPKDPKDYPLGLW